MRVTLFWYMSVSPFVEFPVLARVTLGEAKRVGPAPKCRRSAFSEGPEEVCAAFFAVFQTCFGRNRDPKGRASEAEDRVPPGAGKAPKR